MKNIHSFYMQQAINLAKRGKLTVSPNPMVGCLIVKNGLIIAEGWHEESGKPHAEIYALQIAGEKAKDATVYVTLEPCCHHGKTPPCTDALIKANVRKVVIATLDPNPKVAGKGIKKLKDAGIEVELGVLEKQAQNLNKIFFNYQENHKPFVYAKWAMSLDGKTSVNNNDSKKISSSQAFIKTHKLRNICDGILIGKQTLIDDNPCLNVRTEINIIKNPIRFILFNHIENIDKSWKILDQKVAKTIFICQSISKEAKNDLNTRNIAFWKITKDANNDLLKNILEKMGEAGLTSLLVEGGKRVLESFINEKLINEFVTFLCPTVIANLNSKEKLLFKSINKIGNDLEINAQFKENINV